MSGNVSPNQTQLTDQRKKIQKWLIIEETIELSIVGATAKWIFYDTQYEDILALLKFFTLSMHHKKN